MRSPQIAGAALRILALTATGALAQSNDLSDDEISRISTTKSLFFGSTFSSICGCSLLAMLTMGPSGSEVYWPGSDTYKTETQANYWSQTTWDQGPACVFVPQSAKSVGKGITSAKVCKTDFAIRGGGHMPVPGYTGVRNGILFALSALDTLTLSADKTSVFVGPGLHWGDVYAYLAPQNVYALGARIARVGVPGVILGGGLNYMSNKYGFVMDNVKSYECVLASGHVVTATATSHPELFWALHGGSSNFCIVTKFELKTYPISQMWGGISQFTGRSNFDTWYSAITNFTHSGYNAVGAGVVPLINFVPGSEPMGFHIAAHEGSDPDPAIFDQFKAVVQTPIVPFGMRADTAEMAEAVGNPAFLPGTRHAFRVQASSATVGALKIVHETFFDPDMTARLVRDVPSLISCAVAIQPVPKTLLAKELDNGAGSNTFGIDKTQAYYWYNINCNWSNAADDDALNAWTKAVGDSMTAKWTAAGLIGNGGRQFLYMNDAQGGQDAFASYGPDELARLKTVRSTYDPQGKVFGPTGLSRGGFKF